MGQETDKTDSNACPVNIVKLNPSHESVWNNMQTTHTVGNRSFNAHNKFLEVKVANISTKRIRGIKFVTAYYDSTEDLHTLPEAWGWHGTIAPGETKSANWDNNLWQDKAYIGWVVTPVRVLFEDGTKWDSPDAKVGMFEWWKDKKHPRVNQAPDVNGTTKNGD